MGACGPNTFDDDMACDWVGEFLESGRTYVEETLDRVLLAGTEYLDQDDASFGLAACEVVAGWMGRWPGTWNSCVEDIRAWVAANPHEPSVDLVTKALAVIDRVLSPDSELRELWEGQSDWLKAVGDLRKRVAG